MEKQRLDRFISNQTGKTRSEARTLIFKGLVSVDGEIIKAPSYSFDVTKSEVRLDNQIIYYKKYVYLLMNKPKGVLCATEDKRQKTVIDLIPDTLKRKGLFPVGRLDKDTTGLLLITDDGEFAHKIITPNKNINKTYIAELDGELNESMAETFLSGVVLADGTKTKSAKLEIIDKKTARLTISEGKYHQIKRMFGVVGLGVNNLHRESIGELYLPKTLDFGECVTLNDNEISLIYK